MLRVVQRGHRRACFEPDPDKAPLDALCPECRQVLQDFARFLQLRWNMETSRQAKMPDGS